MLCSSSTVAMLWGAHSNECQTLFWHSKELPHVTVPLSYILDPCFYIIAFNVIMIIMGHKKMVTKKWS